MHHVMPVSLMDSHLDQRRAVPHPDCICNPHSMGRDTELCVSAAQLVVVVLEHKGQTDKAIRVKLGSDWIAAQVDRASDCKGAESLR